MNRLFLIISLLAGGCFALPQSESDEDISSKAVREAYNSMQYKDVIRMVKAELETHPSQNREDLTLYLKYLALALFVEEGEEAATGALTSLLLVDPAFEFSESEASPKILTLFESIRQSGQFSKEAVHTAEKYIVVEDTRNSEILASALFPGQGQLMRNQSRGYIYRAVFGFSLGGGLYYAYLTSKNHEEYLQSYNQTAIDLAYDEYNFSYKAKNNLFLLSLITYIVSLADVALTSK